MKFHIQVQVNGTKATVREMPFLAEGNEGVVGCAFTFDGGWDDFTRTALLRRAGEPTLTLSLDEEDVCALPAVYTSDSAPFYLSVEGTDGACRLRTNEVCLAFRRGGCEGTRITVYEGPYTLQQNRTSYPLAGNLLTQDLTVDVPVVDTSGDTVSPSALLQGYTAHDAQGNAITGTYQAVDLSQDTVSSGSLLSGVTAHNAQGNAITGTYQPIDLSADTVTPGALLQGYTAHNAQGVRITGNYEPLPASGAALNVTYSESPPSDTSKLWIKADIEPEQERVGYLGGEEDFRTFDLGGEQSMSAKLHFDGVDGTACIYGTTYEYNGASGYSPRILQFKPDGTTSSYAIGPGVSSDYDWYALAGCMANGCVYLLLGYGSTSSSNTNKRAVKLYRFDPVTQTASTLATVDSTLYYGLTGGLCVTDDGTVYLYTKTKTSSSDAYIVRFYKYANGALSRIGSNLTGYDYGSSGQIAQVGGRLYTSLHTTDGVALRINPEIGTLETWQLAETNSTLSFLGAVGAYIKLVDSYGLSWLNPQTGVKQSLPLFRGPMGFFTTHTYRNWIVGETQVFAVCYHINGYFEYVLLPRTSAVPAAVMYRQEGDGAVCKVVRNALLTVESEVYGALVTDADGYWQQAELYRYEDSVWTPIGSGTPVVSFTANGTLCHAEQGMTWEQYVASEYNTEGMLIYDGWLQYADGTYVVTKRAETFRLVLSAQDSYDMEVHERVKPEEEIVAGGTYLQYTGTVWTYGVRTVLTDAEAAADNPSSVTVLETASLKYTASEGCALSSTVSVSGAAYTWDADTGTLLLAMPYSDVEVSISAAGFFIVDGTVLHAERGKLWQEWLETSDNTMELYANAGGIVSLEASDGTLYSLYLNGAAVGAATVVSLGAAYTLGTYVE